MGINKTAFSKEKIPRKAVVEVKKDNCQLKHRETLIEKLPKNKRFSLEDAFILLNLRAKMQKKVLKKLFEGPITRRTAVQEFSGYADQLHNAVRAINRKFREYFENDAVLRIPIWNFKTEDKGYFRRFWVLMLNPKIFNVLEKVVLLPGVDITAEDLLGPKKSKVFFYVHANPFCSGEEIRKRFGNAAIIRLRTDCKPRNLHPAVELWLPSPILRTETEPALYWANKKFTNGYSVSNPSTKPFKKKRKLKELFSDSDVELLCKLAKLKIATIKMLTDDKFLEDNIQDQFRHINRRCKELGLPPAVVELIVVDIKKLRKPREFKIDDGFMKDFASELST